MKSQSFSLEKIYILQKVSFLECRYTGTQEPQKTITYEMPGSEVDSDRIERRFLTIKLFILF